MNILATQYNPAHKALELYVAGCKRRCPGCHNPEGRSFNQGDAMTEAYLARLTAKLIEGKSAGLFDSLWLLGGDPLDQPPEDLFRLVEATSKIVKVWLWTGKGSPAFIPEDIRSMLYAAKCGAYDADIGPAKPFTYAKDRPAIALASCNQQLYIWDKEPA